ncbi:hypothetical protein PVAP13_2NG233503 [Panicum virgatum]|uniref:Uncharacterized protein n=1 Tax=Panicum virgatum TaxID=38727 RepID=A0A8T0VAQ7_PANVG|nr:hypothetical protein PVAP13_2NG233503 [Panicum virgatum]
MAAAARATRGHGWSGHASRRRAAVLLGALPACASTPAPGYSPPLPRPRHGAAVAAVSGTAADGLPFFAPSRWPAARAPLLPPSLRSRRSWRATAGSHGGCGPCFLCRRPELGVHAEGQGAVPGPPPLPIAASRTGRARPAAEDAAWPAAEDAARDGAGAGMRRRVRPVAKDAARVVARLTAAAAGARRRARRVRRLARRRPRRRGSTGLRRARRALRRHRGSDGFKVED